MESLARLVCHELPKENKEKEQFFCVLYLKPGDYHRIHSPCRAEWNSFTHASGSLFPMIGFLRPILPSLFSVNERVVLHGNWKHGNIDMVAVAAFGVGAITLTPVTVHTNLIRHTARVARNLRLLTPAIESTPIKTTTTQKNEDIGEFRMGSTIVLVFDAPVGTKFAIDVNETVKVGRRLLQ
jgi:phosphatidylserine decarboxylase